VNLEIRIKALLMTKSYVMTNNQILMKPGEKLMMVVFYNAAFLEINRRLMEENERRRNIL
jgi:hypothetical protein